MELAELEKVVDSHSGCKKLYKFMSQDKVMYILDLKGLKVASSLRSSAGCAHGMG